MNNDDFVQELYDRISDLENALKWIHYIAALHYMGAAFQPVHMKTLANLAADALNGEQVALPNYEQAMERAKEGAEELIKNLGLEEKEDADQMEDQKDDQHAGTGHE